MDAWLKHWNLTSDPFSTEMIKYSNPHFFDYFVKTENIEKIEKIFDGVISSSQQHKIVILGERGSGKSTAINYLIKKIILSKNKKEDLFLNLLPIHLSVQNVFNTDSPKELINTFYDEFLNALKKSLNNENFNSYRGQGSYADLENKVQGAKKVQGLTSRFELIDEICSEIKIYFPQSILFIDNVDLPKDKERIENWLINSQGFFEEVLWNNNINTLTVGGGHLITSVNMSHRFSWFYDEIIEIEKWVYPNIREMIDKRLYNFSTRQDHYSLSKVFEEDALKEIYSFCLGHPRHCQNAVRHALKYASEIKTSPISTVYIKQNRSSIEDKIFTDTNERKNQLLDHICIHAHYRIGYNKIVRLLKMNKHFTPSLITDLLNLKKNNNASSLQNRDLLIEYEILCKNVNQFANKQDKYELDRDVFALLQELMTFFKNEGDLINFIEEIIV